MQGIAFLNTPVGWLKLIGDNNFLTAIEFTDESGTEAPETHLLNEVVHQLQEYFAGKRFTFDLPLKPRGTPFQQKVWRALLEIPYGQTVSYKDIAIKIDSPKAVRAIGMANAKNPIPIIIPCHRVIGANGKLVGYSSGLWRKEWLLRHERALREK